MLVCGDRLGEFVIERLLGKGGMGEVYLARQSNPSRRVALKVLAPHLLEDPHARERFVREAMVPAQLEHHNIVPIYSSGVTEDGRAYYAMQMVDGLSLAALIRCASARDPPTVSTDTCSEPPPPLPEGAGKPTTVANTPTPEGSLQALAAYRRDRYETTIRLGIQAARALAWAHLRGVLHRDLKPSNLMVDRHDHLFVVDFGLTLGPGSESLSGALRGTPWYMSPEQARGERLDGRSDIYALGVTLFEMATGGQGPYDVNRYDIDAVLEAVRQGRSLPLHHFVLGAPPGLARVIEWTMQSNCDDRCPDGARLADELEAVLRSEPAKEAPLSVKPPRSRWRWLALAAGLLLTLATSIALWPGVFGQRTNAPADAEPKPAGADRAEEKPPQGIKSQKPPADGPPRRRFNHKLALLTEDHRPLWPERLTGNGTLGRTDRQATLSAPAKAAMPTLVRLDDDPGHNWFEFSMQIKCLHVRFPRGKNETGVFFGWRHNPVEPALRYRFFAVQIDEREAEEAPYGRLIFGSWYLEDDREGRVADGIRPFPGKQGTAPLPAPASKQDGWRQLRIRALHDRVKVFVDKMMLIDVDTARIEQRGAIGGKLDPRGALGIWAKNGAGFFRDASVFALDPVENRE
jgi:serine/threonine protein kinase